MPQPMGQHIAQCSHLMATSMCITLTCEQALSMLRVGGVYTAQERISTLLERNYREKMPYKIVEQVLKTGIFTASGTPVDYSAEVEDDLSPLRSSTLNLLSEKWQK